MSMVREIRTEFNGGGAFDDAIKLADRHLYEINVTGHVGIPARRVLGNEINLQAVHKWWYPPFQ